ncbi:NADH-quinone oxidoreductase subunit J [Candidatus Paracaedibacter symbiosus]|uniref:NADH-quinone oxidoreductase subunit J n=1 Tax=Candidatus Paracaedibacter symbiosus TaxID=244582 RepID=UPI000509A459|nr:NADH-quinone oxidoreductase subunit J [Candidatus Paracaedibacter symbiosus]
MGHALLFYLFSAILISSAVTVIVARNTVHSVLFLILGFLNAAGLFLLLGAELIAMTLIIVYVGAVAVLFLFVVMMLDINFQGMRQGMARYGFVGLLLGFVFAIELGFVCWYWKMPVVEVATLQTPMNASVSNAHAIGLVLYTDYLLMFQLAGVVLLVAMIGAIVLTLRHRPGVRRQNPRQQLLRSPAQTLELKQVEPGKGVNL